MMKRLLVIVALASILIAGALAQEQRVFTYGSIAGIVTDSATGKPIAGADLTIKGPQLGALTDPDGRFIIGNVPAGKYKVVCQHIGFSPIAIDSVQVTDGQTILDICLPPFSDPCSQSFSDMITITSPPNTVYSAASIRLKGANHSLFLCAAQLAGSSRDPWEQAKALRYVVNRCCAAGRVDLAIQILEAISDEFALTVALEGIDSLSVDDRRDYDRQTYYHVGDWTDDANSNWSTVLYTLNLTLDDLERLAALLPKVTLSRNRIAVCVKIGSLLDRFGKASDGISVTRQALLLYDSLGFGYDPLGLGKAAIAVGDTAAGIAILARALAPEEKDPCGFPPILATPSPEYATKWTLLDVGAYDVAMSTCSSEWDSVRTTCDVAVSIARKGRCEDALRALESVPVGERRADALASVAVLCARQGNPRIAFTALPIALNDYVSDSIKHLAWLGDPVSDATRRVVEGFANSGLFDTALVIARSIRDTAAQCEAIRQVAASLQSVGRETDSFALLEEAYRKSHEIKDSLDQQQVLDFLSYTCLQFGHLSLAKEMLASFKGRCFASLWMREQLAFEFIRSGDHHTALTIANQEIKIEDRLRLRFEIADSCQAMGDREIAIDIVEAIFDSISTKHILRDPSGKAYFPEAVAVFAALGQDDRAISVARRCWDTDLLPIALAKIAAVKLVRGEMTEAFGLLSEARRNCDSLCSLPYPVIPTDAWNEIINTYLQVGAHSEALSTVREVYTSALGRASVLADIALAFSKTGRELNEAEKAELRQIISQYCD